MTDPRISNLARTLVRYSSKVKHDDLVAVLSQPPAGPLIREIFREALKAGGHPYFFDRGNPVTLPGLDGLEDVFLHEAMEEQLSYEDPVLSRVAKDLDV